MNLRNKANMKGKVLITGGAGFIGSYLTDELIGQGYSVRILDNLSQQIQETRKTTQRYLNSNAELLIGDIRDPMIVSLSDLTHYINKQEELGNAIESKHEFKIKQLTF